MCIGHGIIVPERVDPHVMLSAPPSALLA